MSFACYLFALIFFLYVLIFHSYISRMYSYAIRTSFVRTRMSSVCHSYVLVSHPYVTRMWFYHEPTLKAFDDFKNKQKSVSSNVFLICKSMYNRKMHLIDYTFLKNSFGQNKRYKKCLLFSFVSSNSSQFYF